MYGHNIQCSKSEDHPGKEGYQSCSWSARQGKLVFTCPCLCLRISSRETVFAVPSRVSLLISIVRLNQVLTLTGFLPSSVCRPSPCLGSLQPCHLLVLTAPVAFNRRNLFKEKSEHTLTFFNDASSIHAFGPTSNCRTNQTTGT